MTFTGPIILGAEPTALSFMVTALLAAVVDPVVIAADARRLAGLRPCDPPATRL
jgi:hypothetical protein